MLVCVMDCVSNFNFDSVNDLLKFDAAESMADQAAVF